MVPVICTDGSVSTSSRKPKRLMVPGAMKGKDFRNTLQEQTQWADTDVPMLGGVPIPDDALVAKLDEKFVADDGFLYVTYCKEPSCVASVDATELVLKRIAEEGEKHELLDASTAAESQNMLETCHMPVLDTEELFCKTNETVCCEELSRVLTKKSDCVPV